MPTIIVSPENVGYEFFSLILPMNPNTNAFEGQSSSDFISTNLIKYEFASSNENWEIQNNVFANKKSLNTINEFVIKGTIYSISYVEFSFNVKFIKSVNTSSMFIQTWTFSEQQGAIDSVNIQATKDHNIINVVSEKETANFFNLTLPKVTTDGMFTGLEDISYLVGSKTNYVPLYSTNSNLDFSNLGENPLIYNKLNKPLSSTNNKFNINVIIYDIEEKSIKIPFLIIFNI